MHGINSNEHAWKQYDAAATGYLAMMGINGYAADKLDTGYVAFKGIDLNTGTLDENAK